MDSTFYRHLLFDKELMMEGLIITQKEIKVQRDESTLEGPIHIDSSLVHPFEETMKVQLQIQEEKGTYQGTRRGQVRK